MPGLKRGDLFIAVDEDSGLCVSVGRVASARPLSVIVGTTRGAVRDTQGRVQTWKQIHGGRTPVYMPLEQWSDLPAPDGSGRASARNNLRWDILRWSSSPRRSVVARACVRMALKTIPTSWIQHDNSRAVNALREYLVGHGNEDKLRDLSGRVSESGIRDAIRCALADLGGNYAPVIARAIAVWEWITKQTDTMLSDDRIGRFIELYEDTVRDIPVTDVCLGIIIRNFSNKIDGA